MGDKSAIQWTDASWNMVTGCDIVSPGCTHCYARTLAPRLQRMAHPDHRKPTDPYMRDGDPKTSGIGFGLMMHPDRLDQPIRWKRPRRIFTNSMSDLFHPEVTNAFLDQVFAVMALAPQHIFQVLTKRPERMRAYLAAPTVDGQPLGYDDATGLTREEAVLEAIDEMGGTLRGAKRDPIPRPWVWPLPNVWLGTSVENQRWTSRIGPLVDTPAAVRFLSCEPLLGPLEFSDATHRPEARLGHPSLEGIGWVIVGGESGPGARPMDEAWVRSIVAQCRAQGVAPFVKQFGEVWSRKHFGHGGHAGDIEKFPADLQIREWPVTA